MAATHQHSQDDFAVVIHGSKVKRALKEAKSEHVCSPPDRVHFFDAAEQVKKDAKYQFVYCVSFVEDLLTDEDALDSLKQLHVNHKKFLLFSNDIGPESTAEVIAALDVRSPERIHAPRFCIDTLESFCRRFVGSLCAKDSHYAILDAWWEPAKLVVKSATFESLKVPLPALPKKLREATQHQREKFEIDEHGDMITWPTLDVDMSWDQFSQAVDPQAHLRAKQSSDQFNASYGASIRLLRETHGLNQSDIAGLDARTVRRIESGETRATLHAIEKLAKAHGKTTNEYMNAVAEQMF